MGGMEGNNGEDFIRRLINIAKADGIELVSSSGFIAPMSAIFCDAMLTIAPPIWRLLTRLII